LSYGLPTVTTSIGAVGMGLVDRHDVLIGEDENTFARAVTELYHDRKLWHKLAENSLASIEKYSPIKVQQSIKNLLEGVGINLLD
jgi:glycosyltransferase involved in cell wall biosynthesis